MTVGAAGPSGPAGTIRSQVRFEACVAVPEPGRFLPGADTWGLVTPA